MLIHLGSSQPGDGISSLRFSRGFAHSLQANTDRVPYLGHNRVFRRPFQLIIF